MPSSSSLLPRPAQLARLCESAEKYPLTVVCAPMGYGKTTLARALTQAAPGNAYYYAVPEGPHDTHFLWHDMFNHLMEQGMGIAPAMLRSGFPEAPSQWRQSLDELRGLPAPLYLILDDCHQITDPALLAFWARTVREKLPNFRLILFSRTRPDMALEELHIKRYAAVWEQSLLAFTPAETKEYFSLHGAGKAVADEAQQYSEGWPAALWLCLQSWKAGGTIATLDTIDSILAGTVFAAYSRDEQDLLMRLSVLESFTNEDAHTIAEAHHSASNLRALRERNAFLTFDGKTNRYQFHSIFREFLLKELALAPHIDKPALYRLAGECCAKRYDLVAASRLFSKAGRDEDLVRLLDTFLEWEKDRNIVYFAEERFAAATATPWRVRLQNPLGWLAVVDQCSLMWNDHRTAMLMDEAEEHFRTAPELPEYMKERLQGEIEVLRASLAFNDADKILQHFTKARTLLKGPSAFASQDSVWNFGSPLLSWLILRTAGEYRELVGKEEEIISLYSALSSGIEKGSAEVLRAEYLLERGECTAAVPLLLEAMRKCGGDDKYLAGTLSGAFNLARVHIATGCPNEALGALVALRPRVERLQVIEHFECIDMAEGYINSTLGRLAGIPQWLREGDVFDPPHCSLPHVHGISLTIHGKALLLQENYQRLATIAGEIENAAPITCLCSHIHSKSLQAIAAWHMRNRTGAMPLLREALALARPDGLILQLAEYGEHILPLLKHLRRSEGKEPHLAAVVSLAGRIAHITAQQTETAQQRSEKGVLTPREQEVMQHVVAGESNPVIAENLGVSRDAVKKVLGRAYVKLGAQSRFEAAQRFMELYKHLPPPAL